MIITYFKKIKYQKNEGFDYEILYGKETIQNKYY